MTTTNGMPTPKAIRRAIETLSLRREWLVDKLAMKFDDDPIRCRGSYEQAEINALDLAIDVLETEWDTAARFTRNHRNVPFPRDVESKVRRPARWEGPEPTQPEI